MEAQAITEAEIKEQQLVIAQWMQVPEEIIGILNQELPWRIREWIYLCALDQMPAETLEKMPIISSGTCIHCAITNCCFLIPTSVIAWASTVCLLSFCSEFRNVSVPDSSSELDVQIHKLPGVPDPSV